MKDIKTRQDLELILAEFYKVATADTVIGHHFDDLDLESHLPVIVNFWEKMLFGKPIYFGNPLAVHKIIHEKSPLTKEQFKRWLSIFCKIIDARFEGEISDYAKNRANMISQALNQQINNPPDPVDGVQIKK